MRFEAQIGDQIMAELTHRLNFSKIITTKEISISKAFQCQNKFRQSKEKINQSDFKSREPSYIVVTFALKKVFFSFFALGLYPKNVQKFIDWFAQTGNKYLSFIF